LVKGKKTHLTLSQHGALTWALILGLCLLMLPGVANRAQAAPPDKDKDFMPSQVVVELQTNVDVGQINAEYETSTHEPPSRTATSICSTYHLTRA
jgi:hypothetical protein